MKRNLLYDWYGLKAITQVEIICASRVRGL